MIPSGPDTSVTEAVPEEDLRRDGDQRAQALLGVGKQRGVPVQRRLLGLRVRARALVQRARGQHQHEAQEDEDDVGPLLPYFLCVLQMCRVAATITSTAPVPILTQSTTKLPYATVVHPE